MKDDADFEKGLSGFKPSLRSDLKQDVMAHYSRSFPSRTESVWWRKPIPLYKAAAAAVLFAALSLYAGANILSGTGESIQNRASTIGEIEQPSFEIKPVIAVNSQF